MKSKHTLAMPQKSPQVEKKLPESKAGWKVDHEWPKVGPARPF